jgi:hypothetical protein
MTVFAVPSMAGVVVWSDGAGESVHNIVVRIALGLIYGVWGLAWLARSSGSLRCRIAASLVRGASASTSMPTSTERTAAKGSGSKPTRYY